MQPQRPIDSCQKNETTNPRSFKDFKMKVVDISNELLGNLYVCRG